MKEYVVEVEMKAWASIHVFAESAEEAENAAWDMATLDDADDWTVFDVWVEDDGEE